MKKFVSLCAFVAALSFVSCGGNTANQAADSARIADSLDSVRVADSIAQAATMQADSAAACCADSTKKDSVAQ